MPKIEFGVDGNIQVVGFQASVPVPGIVTPITLHGIIDARFQGEKPAETAAAEPETEASKEE